MAELLSLARLTPEPPTAVLGDLRPFALTYTELRDLSLGRSPAHGLTAQDFQATGTSYLVQHNKAILADLMGMGKTKQFIDAAVYVADKNAPVFTTVLVLCKASSVETWVSEVNRFAPGFFHAFAYYGGNLIPGLPNDYQYKDIRQSRPDFVVMSYAQYRNNWQQIDDRWGIIAMDEPQSAIRSASELHGKSSQIGERIRHLKAPRKYLITASPGLRHLGDFWNMLKWLGVEDMDWDEFEKFHLKTVELTIDKSRPWLKRKKITGNTEHGIRRIKEMLQGIMCRRTNELDLPPCTVQDIFVPMTAEEARDWRQIKKDIDAEMITHDDGVRQLRLATSNIRSKLDEAESIVTQASETDERTIIFTRHLPTLRSLYGRFNKYGMAYMHGGISTTKTKAQEESDRQAQITKFQTDPTCKVMICTQQTGGEGLNLTAASVVIFMDRSTSDEENKQAIKRADRIGQTRPVKVFFLKSIIQSGAKVRHVERELDAVIAKSGALIGEVVG